MPTGPLHPVAMVRYHVVGGPLQPSQQVVHFLNIDIIQKFTADIFLQKIYRSP